MRACAPMRQRARPKVIGVDGASDFNALHSGKHNEEVQLCAFDVLALDRDDYLDALPASVPNRTGAWAGLVSRER